MSRARTPALTPTEHLFTGSAPARAMWKALGHVAVVVVLLCLGLANLYQQATWSEPDDGVLWVVQGDLVVAAEVAPDSAAGPASTVKNSSGAPAASSR